MVMDFKKEFEEAAEVLKRQRDEIEVQIHLASMDAKEDWQKAESNWGEFVDALGEITDDTKEASDEVLKATKIIGDELKETYNRISHRLSRK